MDLSVAWASRDLSDCRPLDGLLLDVDQPLCEWCCSPPLKQGKWLLYIYNTFVPPTFNAFCSCTVHLSPQLHTFRRKQKPGARRRKLELQVNQKVWKHVTLVKEISDTLLPCKHLHKKITCVVSIPKSSSDAPNTVQIQLVIPLLGHDLLGWCTN